MTCDGGTERVKLAMASVTVVDAARESLGPVGAYVPVPITSAPSADLQRDAASRLERAGYRSVWINETVGGRDPMVQLAILLAGTERMTFGTGVANIWARAPPPSASARLSARSPVRSRRGAYADALSTMLPRAGQPVEIQRLRPSSQIGKGDVGVVLRQC
jgi:hypothetical protein